MGTLTIPFYKYEGLGNDFVLIEEDVLKEVPLNPSLVQALCHRHLGVGGDGILVWKRVKAREIVGMVYYNADGTRAETCFNGLRCIALHSVLTQYCPQGETFIIETDSGEVTALVKSEQEIETVLPGPRFEPSHIPALFTEPEGVIDLSSGEQLRGIALSLGNPHFVVWRNKGGLQELNREVQRIGFEVEHHPSFPQRVNFELAGICEPRVVEMAVWERGVGHTWACGSGATATVCSGVYAGFLNPNEEITVKMLGGILRVQTSEDLATVRVRGPARQVFQGVYRLS